MSTMRMDHGMRHVKRRVWERLGVAAAHRLSPLFFARGALY